MLAKKDVDKENYLEIEWGPYIAPKPMGNEADVRSKVHSQRESLENERSCDSEK